MQPTFIDAAQWGQLVGLIHYLFLFVLSVIVFAFSLLMGHALIPSLVATNHLPRGVQRVRPLFYLMALLALGGIGFFLWNAANHLGLLRDIYPRFFL